MDPKTTTTNKPTEAGATGHKPETTGTATSTRTTPASQHSPATSSTAGQYGQGAATATQQSRDRYAEAYREGEARVREAADQASQVASEAWNKASHTINNTYEHTLDYGRENPGRVILIAFGAGVAVGLLLASSAPSRSRGRRIVPPVMNALTEIVEEFFH